jgi:hypothetical protein
MDASVGMKKTGSTTSLCGIGEVHPDVPTMSSISNRKPGDPDRFIGGIPFGLQILWVATSCF